MICYFDASLWTKLLIMEGNIGYIDKYVAGWRIHSGQVSSSSKVEKLRKISEYEKTSFIKLFRNLKDINIFKQVFYDNKFIKTLDNLTEKDMQFILHYEMMMQESPSIKLVGYNYIYELLQNDVQRDYIEKRFKFGIGEFRQMYSVINRCKLPEITTRAQIYLLAKKILKYLTFYELRNKSKKPTNL